MQIGESDLEVGARVVYPNQGVCRVVGTTELEIGGRREAFIKLAREDDQATVMVPRARLEKVGLRKIADASELKKIFVYLSAPVEGPELDWKVRHRSHGERMSEGGLMGLAEVVKGLTTLADLRPLPPKERELYDNARHLLVTEVAAASSLPLKSAEDAIDLALFPPGVERKKPPVALELPAEALGLDGGEELPAESLEALGDDLPVAIEEPSEEPGEEEEPEEEAVSGEEEEKLARAKPARAKKPATAAPRKAEKAAASPKKAKPAPKAKPKPAKPTKPAKPAKAAKPKAKPEKAKPAAKSKAKKK